ncbi:MAG: c-type cytochrome [Deltaproteobacteria bacterium]|nr:c-type cytochrome [Deltaproteobacteria bacterium]
MSYVPDERRSFELHFFILAVAFALVTAWAVVDEVWLRRPWKEFQEAYVAQTGKGSAGIRQIVVPELGLVDRCPTCHAGVEDPKSSGEEVDPALRTHPRLDTLLVRHPPEKFGCTSCHRGQGLALTVGSAHGESDPAWPTPMERGPYVESLCGRCHREGPLQGAPILTRGRATFDRLGCGGCHVTERKAAFKKHAPSLMRVRAKLYPGAMLQWIRSPERRRRTVRMPQFWPDGGPQREEESLAIAAYLLANSDPFESTADPPEPTAELAERGRRIFDGVGCRGCHTLGLDDADDLSIGEDPAASDDDFFGEDPPSVEAREPIDFAPALGRVRARVTYEFLVEWIHDPQSYWAGATMPRFRLSRAEAAAVAAFLVRLSDEAPPADPAELLPPLKPALVARGKALIRQYGCNGCHEIRGFEGLSAPGPDLSDYGQKAVHEMYFGDDPPSRAQRSYESYTRTKLSAPRFYRGKSVEPVMPDFGLSDEEVTELLVSLRALTTDRVALSFQARPPPSRGAELLSTYNCGGCHTLGAHTGDISRYYQDQRLAPPTLKGEGARVQPEWLFRFLLSPRPLRPWLQLRMPTFSLSESDARAIVRHFSAEAGLRPSFRFRHTQPYTKERAALGVELFTRLKCFTCHKVDGSPGTDDGNLAPDLRLARERLDAAWVLGFLDDPGALLPGTSMPQFFPPGTSRYPDVLGGEAALQKELVVDHLMNLGPQPVDGSFEGGS